MDSQSPMTWPWALGVRLKLRDRDESMGSILMQDAILSVVTEGRVDPAFHPSGVGKMGLHRELWLLTNGDG